MKRISQAALVAVLACGAQVAYSQQSEQQGAQANDAAIVAQAGPGGGEQQSLARQPSDSRAPSTFESTGLAGDGPYPSKGGPLDE